MESTKIKAIKIDDKFKILTYTLSKDENENNVYALSNTETVTSSQLQQQLASAQENVAAIQAKIDLVNAAV
jgi:hypothetical protein